MKLVSTWRVGRIAGVMLIFACCWRPMLHLHLKNRAWKYGSLFLIPVTWTRDLEDECNLYSDCNISFHFSSKLLVLNNNAEVPPCSVPWQHGNGHSPNHDQEILLAAVTDWKVWTKTLDASWSWVVWLNVSLLQLSRRLVQLIQNRLVHFLDLYWRDLHAVDGNWNGSNCRRLIIIKISTPRWGEFSDATHPNWHSIMWSCTRWWSICQV